ncbi:hypothetical protein LSTR_LSTR013967 [Laodelphax striatellus]|uniref:Uncharacterized protein n=1 Tax=Laodelphax striatellus TaxID=195883 RepID=A0A482WSM6_LAOST|nr:hypothetical protein LSTR_LSTR013967 [Laodelphax striatellus]
MAVARCGRRVRANGEGGGVRRIDQLVTVNNKLVQIWTCYTAYQMFFQIVECCHFLSNQGGKDQGLVTLLTGSPTLLLSSTSNGFSPLGIASSAGINIEHIESFHSKWKSSSKSHG